MSGTRQRISGQVQGNLWSNAVTYNLGDIVRLSGLLYVSLVGSNLNHSPTGTATDNAQWAWFSEAHTGPPGGGTN